MYVQKCDIIHSFLVYRSKLEKIFRQQVVVIWYSILYDRISYYRSVFVNYKEEYIPENRLKAVNFDVKIYIFKKKTFYTQTK